MSTAAAATNPPDVLLAQLDLSVASVGVCVPWPSEFIDFSIHKVIIPLHVMARPNVIRVCVCVMAVDVSNRFIY